MDLKTIGIGVAGGVLLGALLIGIDQPRKVTQICEISFAEYETWVSADEAAQRIESLKTAHGCSLVEVLAPSGKIVLKI